MKTTKRAGTIGCIIAALASATFASAEDVEKKFRIGATLGYYDTSAEVRSDSANILQLVLPSGVLGDAYEDPRNDDAVIGSLRFDASWMASLSGQYAFTKFFVLEGSIGYRKGDLGSIELQAQFSGELYDTSRERFNFHIFDIDGGTLTQVPLQVTALARFRPKATFNPYFGAGIGYIYTGFEPSDELNDVSRRLDAASGEFARLTPFPGGFSPSGVKEDLEGARADAPDAFEWHLAGGAEIGFKKKWSVIIDARYLWTAASFHLQFNGSDSLGVSVPNGLQDQNSIYGTTAYGTYVVGAFAPLQEGLVDGGCLVPVAEVVPGAQVSCGQPLCTTSPSQCVFIRPGGLTTNPVDPAGPEIPVDLPQSDGLGDPGFYYVQGGNLSYQGFSLQFGVRYTF